MDTAMLIGSWYLRRGIILICGRTNLRYECKHLCLRQVVYFDKNSVRSHLPFGGGKSSFMNRLKV
jgi:hypothetical protein